MKLNSEDNLKQRQSTKHKSEDNLYVWVIYLFSVILPWRIIVDSLLSFCFSSWENDFHWNFNKVTIIFQLMNLPHSSVSSSVISVKNKTLSLPSKAFNYSIFFLVVFQVKVSSLLYVCQYCTLVQNRGFDWGITTATLAVLTNSMLAQLPGLL